MKKTVLSTTIILLSLFVSFCKEKGTNQVVILNSINGQVEIKYRRTDTSEKDNFLRHEYIKSDEKIPEGSFGDPRLIPDSETAVKIAFVDLSQIYGEKTIIEEFPLNVDSIGERWMISGTVHSEKGGAAHITLKRDNGSVINLYHEK